MTMIAEEARRADDDLSSMRARAVTIVATTSGLVTVLTGLTTFAASKASDDAGVPDVAVLWITIALGGFVISAALSLAANVPGTIQQADGDDLRRCVQRQQWFEKDDQGEPDTPDQERVAAGLLVTYLLSVRRLSHRASWLLAAAIGFLVLAVAATAVAAVVTLVAL